MRKKKRLSIVFQFFIFIKGSRNQTLFSNNFQNNFIKKSWKTILKKNENRWGLKVPLFIQNLTPKRYLIFCFVFLLKYTIVLGVRRV